MFHRIARIVSGFIVMSALGCSAEVGSGDDAPEGTPGEENLGSAAQPLASRVLTCGHAEGFPTWSWWGYTTAQFTNQTGNGTRAHVMYQAGAAVPNTST